MLHVKKQIISDKHFSPVYLIILAINQSQFKLELSRINSKNSGFTLTVKTVHIASLENMDIKKRLIKDYVLTSVLLK